MTGFREEPASYSTGRMTKSAFLAWNQQRDGAKCELKNGEVVMHPGTSISHGRILRRLVQLLGALDDAAWDVLVSDVAIEIAEEVVRYPDIIVARRASDGRAYIVAEPVVIVEVLSPTSVRMDMVTKASEYVALASLDAYVVASQDEPIVWLWQRDPQSRAFPDEPAEIAGRATMLDLPAIGMAVPLEDIYRGVGAD